MSTLALLDSCVLFPMPLCDTLLRLAAADLYRPFFSQEILDGVTRNLVSRSKMTQEKALYREKRMVESFPESLVEPPKSLISRMSNHPGDRHVVAAAITAKADVIVTFNLKDFKDEDLLPWGLKAVHPDEFLCDISEQQGLENTAKVIHRQALELKKTTLLDLLVNLYNGDVCSFASELSSFFYWQEMCRISKQSLLICGRSLDSKLFLEGDRYRIELQNQCLIISSKERNSEVLNYSVKGLQSTLSPIDVKAFQDFRKAVNDVVFSRKIQQVILDG